MVETARYRARQFFRALVARVSDEELEQAARILTPASLTLFCSMTTRDQRHALEVYRALCQAGHTHPPLLAAALLHDVGKAAARLPPWQRAIIVLLKRFAPRLLARLSRSEARGHGVSGSTEPASRVQAEGLKVLPKDWRRSFAAHARHPEMGARWAEEAGCPPLTVALIRRHQHRLGDYRTEEDQLLAALQAADNLN